MARKRQEEADIPINIQFPLEGLDDTRGYQRQRSGTTPSSQNVRAFEQVTGRARGGTRPGLVKYWPSQVVGAQYPVQDLNYLIATTAAPAPASTIGGFAYSQGSSNGFGIAAGGLGAAGGSIYSGLGVSASYQLGCSCWDAAGNLYVGEINTGTGGVLIYSISPTGTNNWTSPIAFTALASNARTIAGMVVIGPYLFVAYQTGASGAGVIGQWNATSGASIAGTWQATAKTGAFSTAPVNILSGIGIMLGVLAAGGGTPQLSIWNSTAGASSARVALTLFTDIGTPATNAPAHLVSDGAAFFYAVVDTSAYMLAKAPVGGGTPVWHVNSFDSAVSLCYDPVANTTGQLLVLCGSGNSLRSANLATGAVLGGSSPNSTTWNEIDSDGQGDYVIWKNSVASNDVMGVNASLGTRFAPVSLANVIHTGCSMNKGASVVIPPSLGTRLIRSMAMSNGELRVGSTSVVNGVTTANQPASINNGKSFNAAANVIFSAQNGLNMFYADGTTYKYYQYYNNTVLPWNASTAGIMPTDPNGQGCRLIALWRGRTVMAGLVGNPQQLFMSAINDPFNWLFTPPTQTATQAYATTKSNLTGLPGDFINTLIPYSDDTLLIGCDHSIYQLTGDPMSGGQFDLISDTLGIAWGRPWCKDPVGQVYFFGSKCGIFKMTPGALPARVSQQIEKRIENINMAQNIVRMSWDLQAQGMWVFITPTAGGPTKNFFFEERTQAWQQDVFGNTNHQPMSVLVYDGDGPSDRVTLLGGLDGWVRAITPNTMDDGTPISSFIFLGPIQAKDFSAIMFKDMQATLDQFSGSVSWSFYAGSYAEQALNNPPIGGGTWHAGRNPVSFMRQTMISGFVKISSTNCWALEFLKARYRRVGKVLSRMSPFATTGG